MQLSTRLHQDGAMQIRSVVRTTLLIASIGMLGACAESHQRAWANGRGMVTSQAYRAAVRGDMRPDTYRDLMMSANPLRVYYTDLPYRPFGDWRY
jgi:hypothetical protein